jgi:hypothetical protein
MQITITSLSDDAKPSTRGIKSAAFYRDGIKRLQADIKSGRDKKKQLNARIKQYGWSHAIKERKQALVASYKAAMKKKDQNAMDKIHNQIKTFYKKHTADIKKMENLGKYVDIVPKIRAYLANLEKAQKVRAAKLASYKERLTVRKELDLKKKEKASAVAKKKAERKPKTPSKK